MIAHLRRIRSQEKLGEAKYDRFIKDILQLELEISIKVLPDIARDPKNTMVFSDKEKYHDIMANAKYNKQKSKDLLLKMNPSNKNIDQIMDDLRPEGCQL